MLENNDSSVKKSGNAKKARRKRKKRERSLSASDGDSLEYQEEVAPVQVTVYASILPSSVPSLVNVSLPFQISASALKEIEEGLKNHLEMNSFVPALNLPPIHVPMLAKINQHRGVSLPEMLPPMANTRQANSLPSVFALAPESLPQLLPVNPLPSPPSSEESSALRIHKISCKVPKTQDGEEALHFLSSAASSASHEERLPVKEPLGATKDFRYHINGLLNPQQGNL